MIFSTKKMERVLPSVTANNLWGDAMQKQTLNKLGQKLKEAYALSQDLPYPLREALERLGDGTSVLGGAVEPAPAHQKARCDSRSRLTDPRPSESHSRRRT